MNNQRLSPLSWISDHNHVSFIKRESLLTFQEMLEILVNFTELKISFMWTKHMILHNKIDLIYKIHS